MTAIYRFGRFELRPATRQVLVDNQPASLGARAFDVLLALIERRDRLVTKNELLDLVWPGLVVEENNLQVQVSALRKLLGQDAIATVATRGYRFTLEPTHVDAPPPPQGPKHNLPAQLASFIGRERELAALRQLLARNRLVTLVGVGGIGKTRLSLQLATAVRDAYPDGVWFVELAALSDPALIPQKVATELNLKEEPGKPVIETITEHLRVKRLLLLLDNCEHLLDGCANLVDMLVRECPELTILASSREAFGIGGEQAYRVPSLSLPDPKQAQTLKTLSQYESVELFADRAVLVRPDFQVTNQNASTLASICYRLDGIPLAIELAAARVRSLSVEEIADKLDQRFRLLIGGSRTTLPRQQALRSLIDWSYDLLNDSEKLLFQRLSIFAGGWTLAAAEDVCAGGSVQSRDVLDLLASLADKSLVVVEPNEGNYRYRLLETVREYARERLSENGTTDAARERHRDYFLALAKDAAPKLRGPEQAAWLQRLVEEHENLRASLEWSFMEAGPRAGIQLCGSLLQFWWARGHLSEGREWCARILGKAGAEQRTADRATALRTAGVLADHAGDYPAAQAKHEESLAISRELGDLGGIARSLNSLASVVFHQGDYAAGRALQEESLAIMRELGNRGGVASSLGNLGNVAISQGEFASARALLEESLSIMLEIDDRSGIARCLLSLGDTAHGQGNYLDAGALRREGLAILWEVGERGSAIAYSLEGLAAVEAALNSALRAARNWGAAERLREESRSSQQPRNRVSYEERVVAARAALADDAAFERAWKEGRALTLEQAIELALEKNVERG